jgi:dienelactone hydrolase
MGARLAAAGVLARWLVPRLPGGRPIVAHDVDIGDAGLPVPGRLWRPPRRAPAPRGAGGVTPQGNDDPRLVRLAEAVARSGRVVFSPVLGLSERRLDPADVDRVGAAARALADDPRTTGEVSALGFSFGGSYLLVAAADPDVGGRLRVAGAFGAYADLRNLLPQARRADPETVRRLVDDVAGDLVDPSERETVERVLLGEADLSGLPDGLARTLDRLSPVTVADRVDVPVVLLHAAGDTVIPAGELDRLLDAFPDARAHTVRLFTHVDFRPTPWKVAVAVRDVFALGRFGGGADWPPARG